MDGVIAEALGSVKGGAKLVSENNVSNSVRGMGFDTLWSMGNRIGYARVSTADQNLDLQADALTADGCTRVFTDTASGAKTDRPNLGKALDYVREGDTLVVWKLDRLGRSVQHLVGVIEDLRVRGIGFRTLSGEIDTTTSGGTLVFHIFAAIAQFERDLIRERTKAGLDAARARGRVGGRKPKMTAQKLATARALVEAGELTMEQIAAVVGVSRPTLYRHLDSANLIKA